MNAFQQLTLIHVGLTCLAMGLCLPIKHRGARSSSFSLQDKRRTRSSGKRLKVLERMLKQLQPEDVQWLLRQKKFNSYSTNYKDTNALDNGLDNDNDSDAYDDLPGLHDIECPVAEDGMPLFACPTPDMYGNFRCLDEHALCDDKRHCPNGEDEDRTVCMFHKLTMRYFKIMMDTMYGISRTLV